MDISAFAKAIWTFKWLVLLGLVVAIGAALLAGFKFQDGRLQLRAENSYNASETVLLSNPAGSVFQSQTPGQAVAEGETAPQSRDLASTAVIYAYLISGTEIRHEVEEQIGTLSSTENLVAVQRTTQPSGSEQNPGRYSLPIIEIVGTSDSAPRSEEIATAATEAFLSYAAAQQAADGVAEANRVQFQTIEDPTAVLSDDTSNPYIPVVAAGAGVFLAFIALALVLYNVRLRRAADHVREGALVRDGADWQRGAIREPQHQS